MQISFLLAIVKTQMFKSSSSREGSICHLGRCVTSQNGSPKKEDTEIENLQKKQEMLSAKELSNLPKVYFVKFFSRDYHWQWTKLDRFKCLKPFFQSCSHLPCPPRSIWHNYIHRGSPHIQSGYALLTFKPHLRWRFWSKFDIFSFFVTMGRFHNT